MKNWKDSLIGPGTTLRQALETINALGCHMTLVVDGDGKLLGTFSDGDARRALLRGLTLTDCVGEAMNHQPRTVRATDDRHSRLAVMQRLGLHQLPVVQDDGVVVGLEIVDDFLRVPAREEWVVVMAGGLGSRLKELTRETPKPMLNVGSRPLLETILRSFSEQGFRRFYLAVNYRAEQIEAHFGDGSALDIEVRYLREQKRLGTAGALSLLPEPPDRPFIVTNADLLTKEDYGGMVDRHVGAGADATMGVRKYEMQVPFGVVQEKDGLIHGIEEKPVQQFVVSAGMYVLSPSVLELVPSDTFYDMPSLFDEAVRRGMRARCHHIDGYWLDIGRPADYERANTDFHEVFK
ncbi:nucleotidyltransferase family protein [Pelomonas sp. P7]|uniref:Nucleotidyltransferase family protein n=1 Tax=Pelomonas caseinilytica TaxID=2906763 RepID=A0ABS8XI16_9BURK|nr:nucleotidyltransferase family protein [Pelomonas sp. P7]MCE4538176.1 nucleotidyltransferase family protein [Pelomonas sp. P7]